MLLVMDPVARVNQRGPGTPLSREAILAHLNARRAGAEHHE